ncbi:hypothetical protein ACIF83_44340 [Streptomyces sp. NPDC085866]|uniref:hypothetical protein n=1 Tax=Streptomyces sp. NPDC085866 TaxID=3365736 RepID=UPI0037D7F7E1
MVCGEVGLDDDAGDAERQLCTYGGDLLDPSQVLLKGVGDDVRDGGQGAGVRAEFGVQLQQVAVGGGVQPFGEGRVGVGHGRQAWPWNVIGAV